MVSSNTGCLGINGLTEKVDTLIDKSDKADKLTKTTLEALNKDIKAINQKIDSKILPVNDATLESLNTLVDAINFFKTQMDKHDLTLAKNQIKLANEVARINRLILKDQEVVFDMDAFWAVVDKYKNSETSKDLEELLSVKYGEEDKYFTASVIKEITNRYPDEKFHTATTSSIEKVTQTQAELTNAQDALKDAETAVTQTQAVKDAQTALDQAKAVKAAADQAVTNSATSGGTASEQKAVTDAAQVVTEKTTALSNAKRDQAKTNQTVEDAQTKLTNAKNELQNKQTALDAAETARDKFTSLEAQKALNFLIKKERENLKDSKKYKTEDLQQIANNLDALSSTEIDKTIVLHITHLFLPSVTHEIPLLTKYDFDQLKQLTDLLHKYYVSETKLVVGDKLTITNSSLSKAYAIIEKHIPKAKESS
tara:strand:- start:398 stop:1672 length:1275 start_codon:yes stop_codon:yes gene_type:complete